MRHYIDAHKYGLMLKTKTSNHNDDDDCGYLVDDGLKVCCCCRFLSQQVYVTLLCLITAKNRMKTFPIFG